MRWIGVVVVAVLVLGGCGGEDPAPPPRASASSTPVNPSATLPTPPVRFDEFSPTGANRFVHHYVGVMDYASKTGDVKELSRLSDPGCEGCQRYIDLFTNLYADGGWAKKMRWSASTVEMRFQELQGGETLASTTLLISAGTIRPAADADPTQYPAVRDKVTFGLVHDEGWIMKQFAFGGSE